MRTTGADGRKGPKVSAALWLIVAAAVMIAVFAGVILEEQGRWDHRR